MRKRIFTYAAVGLTFSTLQYVWLQFAASGIYQRALEPYGFENISLMPFLLFCIFFSTGLVYFALRGKTDERYIGEAVLRAAIYGALVFTLFQIKNMQFLPDWQLGLSIIDTVWGVVASAASVAFAIIATQKIKL
jgi:uncharacterized membrane protein